jgi:capsid protein/gas vesicle protein
MNPDFKMSVFDKALCAIAPGIGGKRLVSKLAIHNFRYDGAKSDHKRGQAPANMSPNSFDVQRDRLQLMREGEDMERNFAPAKMLNRKVSMYVTPQSYHAQTGDQKLDAEIEDYLNDEVFPNCDVTGRYDFFRMLEFGVSGQFRCGDYGWAFQRPGSFEGMSEDESVKLPLKIQAIEPDRIGGIYQNVVSNDYVSGLVIGDLGQIDAFRVFQRSMTTNTYDNPIDVPAKDFVHYTDPMRIDQYRGVSILATAIQNLRDLYEMMDFVKGKAKLASALTVFTNSNGGVVGNGAFDAYATNLGTGSDASALQQDIQFGQINHLAGGTDIKFPSSNSPSNEEQWLMTQLLKFVAMSYDLPYSFALDAAALGGVSSRLESEMAKATFERFQGVLKPHADRIKNAFLYDAIAKGIFPVSVMRKITKGRWGYRQHPQPDLGREATAAVNLYQTGLLDPLKHWIDNAQDPEDVARSMGRWHQIKTKVAEEIGVPLEDIFGAGPAKPVSSTESLTENADDGTSKTSGKEFSRKAFKESDSSISKLIEDTKETIAELNDRKAKFTQDLLNYQGSEASESLVQRARISIDRITQEIHDEQNDLSALLEREWRRQNNKNPMPEPTGDEIEKKAVKVKKRDDRHAVVQALIKEGYPESQAYAISYEIIESGKFKQGKLPANIRKKYFLSSTFVESDHPRAQNGKFGPGSGGSPSANSNSKTSRVKSLQSDSDNYKKAAESGDHEEAQSILEDVLQKSGFVFHRGKDPESSKNIVQFVDDPSTNKSYGDNQWAIHESDLSEIPDYLSDYSEEYFGDRDSVNPQDVLESADAWDDSQFVSDVWEKFGDRFESEGIVGFKTNNGAVMFPGYGKESGVIPANAIEKDDDGNIKSIEDRFNKSKS